MMLQRSSHSFMEVLRRRRWVALATAVVGAVLVGALIMLVHVKYGATSHVLLVNDENGRDPASAGLDMPTIATSTSVLSQVKDDLHLSESVEDLQKTVTAHVAPRSSIMTIAYRNVDASKAVVVTNGVADAFVAFYSQLPQSRSQAVIKSLGADVARAKSTVTTLERKVEKAAAGQSYVGSQVSLDNVARELGDLKAQRGLAYSQLVSDRVDLANNSDQGKLAKIVRHEILDNNRPFHELQVGVARDESAYQMYRASVSDKFPGIADYKAKIDGEERALSEAWVRALKSPDAYSPAEAGQIVAAGKAQSAVAGDEARLAALDAQIDAANKELVAASSTAGSSLGALRAQRDAAEAQYQSLTMRYSNAQGNAAESNSLGRAVVVDRAVVAEPSLVGPNILLVLGLLVVVAAAIAAAYLAEAVNPRLLGPVDVEDLYGSPSLATLRKR